MLLGVHHAQITVPIGAEDEARQFYCGVLGLVEIPKPESLRGRGGFWLFAGNLEIHVGVESGAEPLKTKAHLAYAVSGLEIALDMVRTAGCEIAESVPIPGMKRFEFRDPFGNRVEMLELDATS